MRIATALMISTLAFAALGEAQSRQPSSQAEVGLTDTLRRMESTDISTREDAFDKLRNQIGTDSHSGNTEQRLSEFLARNSDQADRIKVDLIRMLSFENKMPTENYPEVIDMVASLNDERTIPALVGAMATGGMAGRGIIKYGNKSLEPVLEVLHHGNSQMRASALGTAVTILKKDGNPSSHAQINDLVESALKDSDQSVRTMAVMLVECLPNRKDFASHLKTIAQTDPIKLPGRADDGIDIDGFYPVRFQARRVLRDIQNNIVCKP